MTAVYTKLQPVFNKVWQEFVVDKRPQAMIPGSGCVYRGDGDSSSDTRCAIGVCIPDDMYDSEIDGSGPIDEIAEIMPEWFKSVFNGIDVDTLRRLQNIHDRQFGEFEHEMRILAMEHDLSIPE